MRIQYTHPFQMYDDDSQYTFTCGEQDNVANLMAVVNKHISLETIQRHTLATIAAPIMKGAFMLYVAESHATIDKELQTEPSKSETPNRQ